MEISCGNCQTVLIEITTSKITMKADAAVRKGDKPDDGVIKCSKCGAETNVPGLIKELKRF
jgi:RNase P subunit RPR2